MESDESSGERGAVELRGNLKDFTLPDIIQLVGFGRKTGVLQVEYPGDEAALYFENGDVIHAEAAGTRGEEAVFSLFRVSHGEFRFRTGVPSPDRTIAMGPTNLVMEAARLLDEACRDAAEAGEDGLHGADLAGVDWTAFEDTAPLDPRAVKRQIRELLQTRFGQEARRLLQAVDQCGETSEDFLRLADRVQRYVYFFLDDEVSDAVAQEIRDLVSGPSSL
jgi:hypothetical protein